MTKEELDKVLESHKKWLDGDCGGKRANLHGTHLIGKDLHGANLCEADLNGACLCGADLYGANLSYADLHGAVLSGADLHCADLHGAYLICANLCGANLRDATLYDIGSKRDMQKFVQESLYKCAMRMKKTRASASYGQRAGCNLANCFAK